MPSERNFMGASSCHPEGAKRPKDPSPRTGEILRFAQDDNSDGQDDTLKEQDEKGEGSRFHHRVFPFGPEQRGGNCDQQEREDDEEGDVDRKLNPPLDEHLRPDERQNGGESILEESELSHE